MKKWKQKWGQLTFDKQREVLLQMVIILFSVLMIFALSSIWIMVVTFVLVIVLGVWKIVAIFRGKA